MGRPCSADLRERVVAAVDRGEESQRAIARRFEVSPSFVVRMLQRRRASGGLEPGPHGGGAGFKLGLDERIRLFELVRRHADATPKQIKERGGFDCTLVTIWRPLRRSGWTRKKKSPHAAERDRPDVKEARRRSRRKAKRLDPRRRIVLDEAGVDASMTPTQARAPGGRRAEGSAPKAWRTTTVVAAAGLDGLRGESAFAGAMDEPAFRTYAEGVLAPNLRPGDVVVMDDLRVHDSEAAEAAIERAGARGIRPPPYSPDHDPIEEMWSKLKARLRRIAAGTTPALHQAPADALYQTTAKDIAGWFRHSGLYAIPG